MEQVLCYWPDPADPALSNLRRAMLPLKLRVRPVSPDQTGQSVGFLLGRKGFQPSDGDAPPVSDPILVLDGFTGPRLDALLRVLGRGKSKTLRSLFKAVATPDNVTWTLARLWEELKRERAALEQGEAPIHQA